MKARQDNKKAQQRQHHLSLAPPKIPRKEREWSLGLRHSIVSADNSKRLKRQLRQAIQAQPWDWPKQQIIFITDPHADPEAFVDSLVASGGVKRTGQRISDLKLTKSGRHALFLIGGDCFDKGPSNLGLLRSIKHLIDLKAEVRILAGNHDVRLFLGMHMVGKTADPKSGHFFVRLGHKVVPLLVELRDEYLKGKKPLAGIPDENRCRRHLYPRQGWEKRFLRHSTGLLPEHAAEREIKRLHSRQKRFERACEHQGLNVREVYATTQAWKREFIQPDGEFHWYFKQLRLTHRAGSLLFMHAGINDTIALKYGRHGHKKLNQMFRKQLQQNPFHFYFGPLGGLVRTKYRRHDWPLSQQGTSQLRQSGITALIHGHRNLHKGQRVVLRQGLLNFECDSTMDRTTRQLEQLEGAGAAVTVIHPNGRIRGICSDAPYIKVFNPSQLLERLQRESTKKNPLL